ncbi:MAG: hypothetical protein ACRDYC_05665, partial [Acidimicrobiales bacterium]
ITASTYTASGLTNGTSYYAQITAFFNNSAFNSTDQTNNALVGTPPSDALSGAGSRDFFTYDTYPLSDQTSVAVNVASGDLLLNQGDLTLPGVDGTAEVGQVYNSLDLAPGASSDGSILMSPGWRLDTGPDIHLTLGPAFVIFYDPSGAEWTFTASGSNWNAPSGLDVLLVHQPNGTWTLNDQETNEQFIFDPAGVLLSESHESENSPSPVTFSSENQLSSQMRLTASAGFSSSDNVMLGPSGTGQLTTITQIPGDGSANRVTTLSYNFAGQLISVTDAAGETTTYSYDANGNLSEVTSAAGRHLWFTYDSYHRVIQVDAYSGTGGTYSITTYAYSGAPGAGATTDKDPLGNPTTYSYDSSFRVTATTDAAGFTTSTQWSNDSAVTFFTNQAGVMSANTYGANNNGNNGPESLIGTKDPSGATTSAKYSSTSCASGLAAEFVPSVVTNNVGQTSSLCYDSAGD